MPYRAPARRTTLRVSKTLFAGLLVVTATAAGLGFERLGSSSSSSEPPTGVQGSDLRGALPSTAASSTDVPRREPPAAPGDAVAAIPGGPMVLRPDHRGALGEADGVVPDGTTVFDDQIPGVANLNPDLLGALRRAARAAAADGVKFFVVSGWRSRTYQNQLLRQAVSKYGSEEEAARWVATADTSPHVSGDAVDIGPFDAVAWLSKHGAHYGLCQIYRNEPWHYELRATAIEHGCPRMYADPTDDPRMQQ